MTNLLVFGAISLLSMFLVNPIVTGLDEEYNKYNTEFEHLIATKQPEEQKKKAAKLNEVTADLRLKLKQKCSQINAKCYGMLSTMLVNQSVPCYNENVARCAQQSALDYIGPFVNRMAKDGVPKEYDDSKAMVKEVKDKLKYRTSAIPLMDSKMVIDLWHPYKNDEEKTFIFKNSEAWRDTLKVFMNEYNEIVKKHKSKALDSKTYIALSNFYEITMINSKLEGHLEVVNAIWRATGGSNEFIWYILASVAGLVACIAAFVLLCATSRNPKKVPPNTSPSTSFTTNTTHT